MQRIPRPCVGRLQPDSVGCIIDRRAHTAQVDIVGNERLLVNKMCDSIPYLDAAGARPETERTTPECTGMVELYIEKVQSSDVGTAYDELQNVEIYDGVNGQSVRSISPFWNAVNSVSSSV